MRVLKRTVFSDHIGAPAWTEYKTKWNGKNQHEQTYFLGLGKCVHEPPTNKTLREETVAF